MWFRQTTPINQERSIRNLSFYHCPVTALPVSYHRCPTLCTALSTWSPRFTSCDLYLHCQCLASWAKLCFYFGPPKINGSNTNLPLLWLHNFEKGKNTHKKRKILWSYRLNTIVSFTVLCCFHSMGSLLHVTAHEIMHLLSINTKEGGT